MKIRNSMYQQRHQRMGSGPNFQARSQFTRRRNTDPPYQGTVQGLGTPRQGQARGTQSVDAARERYTSHGLLSEQSVA